GHAARDRKVEQRHGRDNAVEDEMPVLTEGFIQVESVAVDEVDVRIAADEEAEEILGILDRIEVPRLHPALKDRLRDHAGAGAQLEHGQTGLRIDDRGHATRRHRTRRQDRAHCLRLVQPALEEAQFLAEMIGEYLAQVGVDLHSALLPWLPTRMAAFST